MNFQGIQGIDDLDLESMEAMLKVQKAQLQKIILLQEQKTQKQEPPSKHSKHDSRSKRRNSSSSSSRHRSHHSRSRPSKHSHSRHNKHSRKSRSRGRDAKGDKKDKKSQQQQQQSAPLPPVPSYQTQNDIMEEKLKKLEQMEKERSKQIERELEQAKRDDSTVLVLQLPLKITEKEIYKFFLDGQCGKIRDIRIIRDPKTNRAKGIGYVEFYNQDSVWRACAMTGKTLQGNPLQIQPSQAEKNRIAASMASHKKTNLDQVIPPEGAMRIYVGGLTDQLENINESYLKQLFSSFGEIDFVDLHTDQMTGKSKGFAFIQFKRASDAKAALQKMNGFTISNKQIKVSTVQSHIQGPSEIINDYDEESGSNFLHDSVSRATLMEKLTRQNLNIKPDQFTELQMMSVSQQQHLPKLVPTHAIVLKNIVAEQDIIDASSVSDLRDDILYECSNYGTVAKVVIEEKNLGNVYIKFTTVEGAMKAQASLNQRFFAGKQIVAIFLEQNMINQIFF